MCNERLYSSARSSVFYFILRRNQLHTYIQYPLLYLLCILIFLTTEPSWYDLLRFFHFQNRRWHALEEQPKTNNKINKIIHKKINQERLKDKIIEEDWHVKHTEQKLTEGRQEQSDDDRIECESMVKVEVM